MPTPPAKPMFRTLDRPRPPSAPEQRLLSWLAGPVGQELTDQVADVVIVGECSCGCSSVRLSASAAPLPVATISRLSETGRLDYLAVSSTGRDRDGQLISVVLHVVEGRMHELEVFDTDAGEGASVDPADVTALEPPEVG